MRSNLNQEYDWEADIEPNSHILGWTENCTTLGAMNLEAFHPADELPGPYQEYSQAPNWNTELEHTPNSHGLPFAATSSRPPMIATFSHIETSDGPDNRPQTSELWLDSVDPSLSVSSGTSHILLQENITNHYNHFMEDADPGHASPTTTGLPADNVSLDPPITVTHNCIINGEHLVTATYNHGNDHPYSTMSTNCVRSLGYHDRDFPPIPRLRQMSISTPLGEEWPTNYFTFRCDIEELGVTDYEMNVQLLDTSDARYDRYLHLGRNALRRFRVPHAPE